MPISRSRIDEERYKGNAQSLARRADIAMFLYNHPDQYFNTSEIISLVLPDEFVFVGDVIHELLNLKYRMAVVDKKIGDRYYYAISPFLIEHTWADGFSSHICWLIGRMGIIIHRLMMGGYDARL